MIVDLLVGLVAGILAPVLGLLPEGHLALPAASSLAASLAGLDSLVPVLGVLRLGAVMLSLLLVFVSVRVVVFLRYLLLP